MLRKRRDAVVMRIGVAKAGQGALDAHAWVESEDGLPLAGNHTMGCKPLMTMRSTAGVEKGA